MSEDIAPLFVAPGDEAFALSHEGGEHEAFEDLARQLADVRGVRHADSRTRRDRVELQTEHWTLQMDRLVDAYLDYSSRDTGDGLPVAGELEDHATKLQPGRRLATLPHKSHHLYPNEVLIYHGYIGCSPLLPTVAVSLRTLATYRQIHRICPRFGIQAHCKLLCHLHSMPYRPYLNVQLTAAYDVYLSILDHVDRRLKKVLGRDTDNWRMRNNCPACFYKLEDEPALDFDWLVSIDGNNSLKRWDTNVYGVAPRVDTRCPRSDYWLDDRYVDRFKYETQSRLNHDNDVDNWQNPPADADADIPTSFTCVERWRNAGPEQRKRMFSMFHESGIFIASCRHRFVLLACNMVKSGELYVPFAFGRLSAH
ncbi:hypothetical protein PISMIDRAFT_105862 [Pisolithus microcarpus 441]|uniref:CxC1-like cysteine cluster associated with KDZ transposases domain-containing protein n=1 Tax=Pisolithus microcarpus 441 TaxID=765257 RepID=A0A0C9ZD67_9AGAM|nr:hypothetical protein PISMIDRAFT_105862 [Pisolithus microcarpus 441]